MTVPVTAAPEHDLVEVDPVVRDHVAERLFEDFADKESHQPHHYEEDISEPVQTSASEPVQEQAPRTVEPDRVVATGRCGVRYIPMKTSVTSRISMLCLKLQKKSKLIFLLMHLQLRQRITMLMK